MVKYVLFLLSSYLILIACVRLGILVWQSQSVLLNMQPLLDKSCWVPGPVCLFFGQGKGFRALIIDVECLPDHEGLLVTKRACRLLFVSSITGTGRPPPPKAKWQNTKYSIILRKTTHCNQSFTSILANCSVLDFDFFINNLETLSFCCQHQSRKILQDKTMIWQLIFRVHCIIEMLFASF